MSPVDVATKYHIGYNRIYQIWKSPDSANDKVDDKADDDDDLAEFEKNISSDKTPNDLQQLRDEYKTLKYDRDDLQQQLDNLQRRFKDLRDRYNKFRAEIESVKHNNKLLMTQYDSLHAEYNSAVEEVEKCYRELDRRSTPKRTKNTDASEKKNHHESKIEQRPMTLCDKFGGDSSITFVP
ncbi:hypothetical protein ACJMK2_032439 [Sinanodonta woodiana]|uniref:Uncharacterized protein n=1 Tax=Sinanodonta woodiana TaxID=1069815 RepID=A0ABD3X1Q0_SINWO